MNNYTYQNTLISKKQLRQLLSWSFTKYGSVQSCFLADELKYLGFKYATQAGVSISIEDLRVPDTKNSMLNKANKAILNAENSFLRGKITNVERFQKIIDTWNITSESLKDEVVSYFKKYDPLNSVYMMAFSGARGNLSQVRQLVGMRGLMSDPSGEIMNLPIKKNFREGLTITDYLMSGYGARKGIVDTALKTANSGYLTRRLIDVAQDIIIREKDCLTNYSFLLKDFSTNSQSVDKVYDRALGCLLNKPLYDLETGDLISEINTQITPNLIRIFNQKKITRFYIRSPLTCNLYRSICQKCYGWNLARENLVDIGDAVGIIAGQSIGEPGTQLTMRTFHTGGIFTSATSQQIISSINGYLQFSEFLRMSTIRTNRGENVLFTENSGSLTIVSDENSKKSIQIELPRNAILFIKNNQYIKKGTIIGQLIGSIKQTRTEIKSISSDCSGEVFIPKLPRKLNLTTINKLLWILSGQVYKAPFNSFLNFYGHYKISKNSYIFRSKIVNKRSGFIKLTNSNADLSQQLIEVVSYSNSLNNSAVYNLSFKINDKNSLLAINNLKYLVNLKLQNSNILIPSLPNYDFASLIINHFTCLTGGIPYYTQEINRNKKAFSTSKIHFYETLYNLDYRTITWLSEEIYPINCDSKFLFVENNNFIPENFELTSKIFSKTSGVIRIKQKGPTVQEVNIKCGLLYEVYNIDSIKEFDNQVFFPGEIILDNIYITQPCLTEIISQDLPVQLLIRPLEVYEIPLPKSIEKIFGNSFHLDSIFRLTSLISYPYNSKQKVKESKNLNIVTQSLFLDTANVFRKKEQVEIGLVTDTKRNSLKFSISEKLYLSDYIPAYLKYGNVKTCLIIENNQFIDAYTTLGYLEAVTNKSLELVKLKSKIKQNKQIFLISNDDCLLLPKHKIKDKTVNDFVINRIDVTEMGKIIIDNTDMVTVQKGRPYFFPNCKNDDFVDETNLEYKIASQNILSVTDRFYKHKFINVHYYDINNKLITLDTIPNKSIHCYFSKIIIKKRGKVYISGLPIFLREIMFRRKNESQTLLSTLKQQTFLKLNKNNITPRRKKIDVVFTQNSELITNQIKSNIISKTEFASLVLKKYPFTQIGIHSVTEDYLEQDVNSVYVKNGEFVESNQTIGLLNFEKEITGDIVQGLPRIEELLEARKKKKLSKRTPKNQKRGLLIRKTSLDPSFEFRKLGTTIKDNEKINPHNLLKVYFNYYAKTKMLIVQNKKSYLYRLTMPYEASYRSFKKVQSLILNSVQSVYESQGVTIADKHLEIIIKQMTSKVQITRAGDTPLLPHEIIDLYHIRYINDIIQHKNKQPAYYVPLLLGVTKASLNNPSFISAASFQETTRVLTKAAIEGKRDWLRGLKENIVIGQLIPVGTGLRTYSRFFEKFYRLLEPDYLSSNQSTNNKFFSKKLDNLT
jgi:DNA-directed RNA polymerase beta'' subunit